MAFSGSGCNAVAMSPRQFLTSPEALKLIRDGERLARQGWNGEGMYVVMQPGYPEGIGINANTAKATGLPQGTVRPFLPYLMFRTATGAFVPWSATATDLVTDDWYVAPEINMTR
jgi:hypothetical protein